MAPEFPPRLVVLTLEADGQTIVANVENVEPTQGERLRVKWSEVDLPVGYRSVGNGALYVQEMDTVMFDGPRPAKLDYLQDNRYRWIQGTPPDTPFVMIALVLPPRSTLKARPASTSAKTFQDTIAVYWCLAGDRLGRVQVEFELQRSDRSPDEEVRLINSLSSLEDVPFRARIDIDPDSKSASIEEVRVFLCHSSEDKSQVREIYSRLKSDGYAPWLDEVNILPGEKWKDVVSQAVRGSHVILVCLSNKSVKKVGYVQTEIGLALQVAEEQPEDTLFIVPVRLEECTIPDRLTKYQWLDYYSDNAHDRLLMALRKRVSQLRPV